jgi:hypothetical protein
MAVQGIYAYSMWAYKLSGGYYTHSWTLAIPPKNAFAQVQNVELFSFEDESRTEVGFTQVTNVNGGSKSFSQPHSVWFPTLIVYENQMTTLTLTATVSGCYASWIVQIFTF